MTLLLLLAILFSILSVSEVLSQAYYTDRSMSERETPVQYINAYIWNLERWSRRPYMQDSKRDTDIKPEF